MQVLACDHNILTSLPPSLSSLGKLERLNAGNNQLAAVSALKALGSLKQLNLSHNRLTALPASVAESTALQELDVSNNSLQARRDVEAASSFAHYFDSTVSVLLQFESLLVVSHSLAGL